MRVELRVPAGGESITEVQIADWLKSTGDRVRQDEPVVLLETDKAAMELPSPVTGVLAEIVKQKGETATVGDLLAYLEDTPLPDAPTAEPMTEPAAAAPKVMPAARRLMAERGVAAGQVTPTGPGGRLLKEDVLRHLDEAREPEATAAPATPEATTPAPEVEPRPAAPREEEAVPMSLLRRTVAERLVQAQQTAALLTTFNEIDMSALIALRRTHQEAFWQRHNVKPGFMSFFVKTAIETLKQLPGLNAEIRGTDIVYRNYYDIGIAVGGGRGLVVPVLRNGERLSLRRDRDGHRRLRPPRASQQTHAGGAAGGNLHDLERRRLRVVASPGALARYIRDLLSLPRIPPERMGRRRMRLGTPSTGEPLELAIRGRNFLIGGDLMSGKSWTAGSLCEQLILKRYSLCILDPEGDYTCLEALPGVIVQPLGGKGASFLGLDRVLTHPDLSLVVDTSAAPREEKPLLVRQLLTALNRCGERPDCLIGSWLTRLTTA